MLNKILLLIMLTCGLATAQDTTYLDGTGCGGCDSVRTAIDSVYMETHEYAWRGGELIHFKIYYYPSGSIFQEGTCGVGRGTMKTFYESGVLRSEGGCGHYGVTKVYFESGALEREAPYTNGKNHGTSKWYHPSGKLAGTATYKHGELVGYKTCTDGRKGNESLDCLVH